MYVSIFIQCTNECKASLVFSRTSYKVDSGILMKSKDIHVACNLIETSSESVVHVLRLSSIQTSV